MKDSNPQRARHLQLIRSWNHAGMNDEWQKHCASARQARCRSYAELARLNLQEYRIPAKIFACVDSVHLEARSGTLVEARILPCVR